MPRGEPEPNSANLAYVEQLYARYLTDRGGVDPQWRRVFDDWAADAPLQVGPTFTPRSLFNPHPPPNGNDRAAVLKPPMAPVAVDDSQNSLQHRVDQLIRNYRVRGHIIAHLDPLGRVDDRPAELTPSFYSFTEQDLDRRFYATTMDARQTLTLREIIRRLEATYCGAIGVQFMHIDELDVRDWLQQRMEASENRITLSRKEQIRILTRLTDAVIFEQFIQKKFIGAKSFSLEGAESLIPLMDMAFEKAGDQGIREIIIGMAHRGRLSVLANIIGKSPQRIFREFEDLDPERYLGGGDVKYHLGESGDWRTRHGQNIHLSLCFNPSHLEYVNPVALGRLRAKQDRYGVEQRGDVGMVVLIHGDAAFAGEGVVQETLNLSMLPGYHVGGTLHIIVNNQLGFTTSPADGRSSRYASDVARMLQVPILHVNGENPEAVAQVVDLAMDFRRRFRRDVVIDMYCFRRRGHNEGDEPSYTQPVMYDKIEKREDVREAYCKQLLKLGGISESDADRIARRRTELLEKELTAARSETYQPRRVSFEGYWSRYVGGRDADVEDADTGVEEARLKDLLLKQTQLPDSFHLHPKLQRLLKLKRDAAEGKRPIDWATAESLAFASLAVEGCFVRLSGQDSQRGTFSQRHAVFHDVRDDSTHCPLQHLSPDQGSVEIINSPLNEAGVLGFEYGYSLDTPDGLILWEAQFGDFVNAAQVIIDQFIASAEDKWNRLSGLTLLLPHGFEGQGPEHSSARLERFLMLAAEDNITVAQPTTPAQYFHLLRRQVKRRIRKPLVVMTPKSLLRHPKVVSSLGELAAGSFERLLPDAEVDPAKARRIILCTGKVYYDLLERRAKLERDDVTILRLEQLYPLREQLIEEALRPFDKDAAVYFVQEEPRNMGAWPYLRGLYGRAMFGRSFVGVTRPPSASPATGSRAAHQLEQDRLLAQAFEDSHHAG